MRFNRRYRRSGHLWQNRFYSCPLGPSHVVDALVYVDLNPVRGGLVAKATQYPWSSAAGHVSGRDEGGLLDDWAWSDLGAAGDWAERLEAGTAAGQERSLREATYGGIPWGEGSFIAGLEKTFGRRLQPAPPGPVPKAHAATSAGN